MKKFLVIAAFLIVWGNTLLAQIPPAPPLNHSGLSNSAVGSDGSIGSGFIFLIVLAIGYAGKLTFILLRRLRQSKGYKITV